MGVFLSAGLAGAEMAAMTGSAAAADVGFEYLGPMNGYEFYQDYRDGYNPKSTENFGVRFKIRFNDAVLENKYSCQYLREFGAEETVREYMRWYAQQASKQNELRAATLMAGKVANDIGNKVAMAYMDCSLSS